MCKSHPIISLSAPDIFTSSNKHLIYLISNHFMAIPQNFLLPINSTISLQNLNYKHSTLYIPFFLSNSYNITLSYQLIHCLNLLHSSPSTKTPTLLFTWLRFYGPKLESLPCYPQHPDPLPYMSLI